MLIQCQGLIKNNPYVPSFVRPLYTMITNQDTNALRMPSSLVTSRQINGTIYSILHPDFRSTN